jgi:hypothetical protein
VHCTKATSWAESKGLMTLVEMRAAGTTRLSVLNALPRQHQDYFFEAARKLCAAYVASRGAPIAQRESESLELFSEVMAKLLGAVAAGDGQHAGAKDGEEPSPDWTVDKDPKRDGRVVWLVAEIGGRQALAHRHEDIRRRLYGRWREGSYKVEQLAEEHVVDLAVDPIDPHEDEDNRRAWRGLLAAAKSEFEPNEDVSVLLDLLASDSKIQAAFGSEWPVRQIVDTLNQCKPVRPWNDDRVDNAKKRLKGWIGRIRRDYKIEPSDLMHLFAQYARKQELTENVRR